MPLTDIEESSPVADIAREKSLMGDPEVMKTASETLKRAEQIGGEEGRQLRNRIAAKLEQAALAQENPVTLVRGMTDRYTVPSIMRATKQTGGILQTNSVTIPSGATQGDSFNLSLIGDSNPVANFQSKASGAILLAAEVVASGPAISDPFLANSIMVSADVSGDDLENLYEVTIADLTPDPNKGRALYPITQDVEADKQLSVQLEMLRDNPATSDSEVLFKFWTAQQVSDN